MIDNHAQGLLHDYRQCSLLEFARPYCHSRFDEMLSRHVPLSLFYQLMIRKLLARFRCTDLDDYLQMRSAQSQEEHLSGLFSDAGISTVLMEEQSIGTRLKASDMAALTGTKFYRVLPVEAILEKLMRDNDTLDHALKNLESAFDQASQADGCAVVALKTLIASRGGTDLQAATISSARTAYHPARKEVLESGKVGRSASYHYLLAQVLDLAIVRKLPVQIDSGLGDDQALLAEANPLNFQNILRANRFSELKTVFLHAYPFAREVAYLASVYPGVFFDLSLTNSLISPDLTRVYYEALSSAPYSKLLAGTGGHSQPESYWYGATCLRRGLGEALKELVEKGYMLKAQMDDVERAVLRSNAVSLYGLNKIQ